MKKFLLISLLILAGCLTSSRKLLNLKLDMTKAEVQQAMRSIVSPTGKPSAARGSMRNKFGQVIEVWEYVLDRGGKSDTAYWLYFYDGRLVQWGEAGDWSREADKIYELRFR
jgi:hypothetical protein